MYEMQGPSHRYGAPRRYRASRRGTLLRLAIPAALGVTIAGFAIGAGVAYFADSGGETQSPAAPRPSSHAAAPANKTVPANQTAPASKPDGGQSGPRTSSAATRPAPGPATSAEGHRLNDEGYALIRGADYAAAIPPLRRAVGDLAGAGPADPYEAYANYNLGYALLRSGRCTEALAPLETANGLETNSAVDRAIREAQGCAPAGS
jgi:TolA-binding protein